MAMVVLAWVVGAAAMSGGCSSRRSVEPSRATLQCTLPVASADGPDTEAQVLENAVALVTSKSAREPLPIRPDLDHAGKVWSKTGLWIRTGVPSDIAVIGPAWATVMWNNQPPGPVSTLHVPACESNHEWINFAGGYVIREAACVTLEVRTGGSSVRARIPVGAPCS